MPTYGPPTIWSAGGRARALCGCPAMSSWCGHRGGCMSVDVDDDGHDSDDGLYPGDIASVLVTEEQIRCRTAELAHQVAADYQAEHDKGDLLLVGVLKGAVMFMTDLARALPIPVQLEFMAVASYGSATSSAGEWPPGRSLCGCALCCASPTRSRLICRSATSASISRKSSSSDTDWTTASVA